MVRISVEIDEKACAEVMRRYHFKTKREAINFALRSMSGEPIPPDPAKAMTLEEIDALQGIGWDGDLDTIRPAGPSDFS